MARAILPALVSTATGTVAQTAVPGKPAPAVTDKVRRRVLPDPALRSGVLANGVRYVVRHAVLPAHGLSLRLGIDVGSFEERDDERGFAHLVEHLAFRQTRSAPGGGLDARFAALGVAFGRDQNAETRLFATTYRLDFAAAGEKGVDQGFRWLRDVADGVAFTPAGVSTERDVVLAEEEARNGPRVAVREAIARFQAPGLRTTERSPGGNHASLGAARANTVRAFYERWYRPENAVVVVVGDQPVEVLEASVRASFASWQAKGAPPERARYRPVDETRGLDTLGVKAPALPTIATACRLQPPSPVDEDEAARIGPETRTAIWQGILNQRLKALVQAGRSGLLGATVVRENEREFAATCLLAVPSGTDWRRGLAAAQAELRRFAQDGATEREVEAEVEEERATLRGAVTAADARTAPTLADTILARSLDRRPVLSPREAMHAYDVAVEELDPARIRSAFAADWRGAGPLVAIVLPTEVDAPAVRTAWERGESAPALAAYVDATAVRWPYDDLGKPGAVASREIVADPGFVRLRFTNGTVLNFKQLTGEADTIELRAQFGWGRRSIPDRDYIGATLGAGLLEAEGLGKVSTAEIERSFRNTGWQFRFALGNDAFQFARTTSSSNLPTELQVFAAFMSDPGFRADADERIPGAVDIMYRAYGTDPRLVLSEAMLAAVDPTNPERLPPQQRMATLGHADFARLLRPALTGAPVELTIVGDVDEATATKLVAATFGALPPRKPLEAARTDVRFLRFPDHPFAQIGAVHDGPADKAAANLVWPLYVAEPARRHEEYALKLAAAIFNDELRRRVRTQLGKTYSPVVATVSPDHADQGYMVAELEGYPADIDLLIAEAKAVASRLAAGGISADALETVRQPILSAAAARHGRSAWWAAAMTGSARDPAITAEVTRYEAQMTAVTLADVKAAAATWLAKPPIVVEALPRAMPAAADAAPRNPVRARR